jgi:hypothetical protein
VETLSGVPRSMGAFGLLIPAEGERSDPTFLLHGSSYTAGYGKYFSRFLYMLPDDMQEQVRRENAALTDELLAEICGDAQFNANLHPPLLRWEISYPTGESGAADEQLKSSEILVEPDPEDPHTLRLRHGPTGNRVIPVDLGFLNPRMRPPLYQLLSRFTPPVTFGPGLPESPERRVPPAPRPEAKAEDADAVNAADAQPVLEGDDPQAAPAAGATPVAEGDATPEAAVAASPAAEAQAVDTAPAAPPAPPAPTVNVRPRITYGGSVVLARRRWSVPKALFPQREANESAADFFLRANRFRLEHGIPETCYVRINPLPDPPAPKPGEAAPAADAEAPPQPMEADLPGYEAPAAEAAVAEAEEHDEAAAPAAEGGEGGEGGEEGKAEGDAAKTPAKARTAGSRDLHKPQFMDFGNPLLVGLLGKMAANLKLYSVIVEERLPGRDELARTADGAAYATEVVVQLYFPSGTANTPAADALDPESDHAAVA